MTTHPDLSAPRTVPNRHPTTASISARLRARNVVVVRGGRVVLDHADLVLAAGELVAVVGPSGAGKSTLLSVLAGVTAARAGSVRLLTTAGEDLGEPFGEVGLVPQDDILHLDLPLGRTLRHAAGLRIADRRLHPGAVARALEMTHLTDRAGVPVRSLSGGERKRAGIAVELLVRPALCLLDEPTSGLDPATGRALVATLRELADAGAGILFTTHAVADVATCDRVVVVARGGRIVYDGPPAQAAAALGADDLVDVFQGLLADPGTPTTLERFGPPAPPRGRIARRTGRTHAGARAARGARGVRSSASRPARPSRPRQLAVLSRRGGEIILRNRLTAAILLGSPAAVVAMIALLFPAGVWTTTGNATGAVMEAYWLAFAGFFFGLTYGLLQICTEIPVLRRERQSGVSDLAYVGSKVVLLTPLLAVVNVVLLVILRLFDRLPDLDAWAWLRLLLTLQINAVVALMLGLLTSATVSSAAQAALALPMLCFPAVLFSGAMVPVALMTAAGRGLATVVPDRWAFEAISRNLDVGRYVAPGSPYTDLGRDGYGRYWAILLVTGCVLVVAAHLAVRRRSR